jgi:aryl carrier-like protein
LAFEASLGPDSSKLLMTIVAQDSVITQSGASELLEQVECILHEMLLKGGQNVVLEEEAGTEKGDATNDEYRDKQLANATSDGPNGFFAWTEEAQNIKEEVASLANVAKDTVHESSSIFELGLDSIDVIKLSSRLKKRGVEIPVSVIIKCQTIAKMVTSISIKNIGPQASPGQFLLKMQQELTKYLKIKGNFPRGTETVLPATPLQQSMVNEMIKSGYSRYFNVDGFKLRENVDMKRLMDAIKTVIEKTPVLRGTFVEIEDPKLSVSYAQIIHNELVGKGKLFSTYYLAQQQSFQGFLESFKEYATGRAAKDQALLQVYNAVGHGERYLVIAISHALYDGTSLQAFHHDIQGAYQGKLSPRPDFLPFLEQVFLSTTEEAKKFWRTTLSNLPSGTFPRKKLTGSEEPETSWRLERRSRVSFKDVEALCKSSRVTLQTIGQTCWALVLSHLMGQLDVVFGTVLSCRDSEEANEAAFPLMNTVVARAVVHGSLGEMLKYTQDISDASRQFQHFPLGKAQAYALALRQNQASSTDTTLFDTLFIYQGRRSAAEVEPLYESVYGSAGVEFLVCVEMEIVQDEYLTWTTACKSTARNAQETEDVIEALEKVLERIVYSSNDQAFVSDAHGISVGGLPKFNGGLDEQSKTTQTQPPNDFDDEWSSTESTLRKALHELSGVPEDMISKDSTIFQLGLDSILVLKLPALLKVHGIRLSVSDILSDQTISLMAKTASEPRQYLMMSLDVDSILQNAMSSLNLTSELELLQKEVGEIQYVMPITAGQLYMIKQWQASKGTMFYQTFAYSHPGPINKMKLVSAWKTLLERYDILRTGFLEVGSNIVQVVFKNPPNDVIYHTKEQLSTTRKQALDLRAPPAKLTVEESKGSSVIVRLVLHHALYDGISLPILIDELLSLSQGMELEVLPLAFKDFIAQSILSSLDPHLSIKWRSYLNGSTLYPTKFTNWASTSTTKMRTEVFHPSIRVVSLKRTAQDIGVSIDALLLAALSKIYALSLQAHYPRTFPHVTFGIYLANRAPFGEDLSLLAAPTLNLLPLRVEAPLQKAVEQIAKQIQKNISKIGSREVVGASLEKIYECTGTRINFMVNILKSENTVLKVKKKGEWEPVQDLGKRAEVVEQGENTNIDIPVDDEKRFGAYLVSALHS